MKYEKIGLELVKWVDKGFFSDVWYFIKDISNFNVLFILQNLDFIDFNIPVHEIDNQSNYLIGILNGKGFTDYLGHIHPINMNDVFKEGDRKYRGKDPTYDWIKKPSILNIDLFFSRKIEEVIWYMIKNRSDFDVFVESMKDFITVENEEKDENDYDRFTEHSLSFVGEVIEVDNTSKYHEFFGFDPDEYYVLIDIENNLIEDEILEKVNEIIKAGDNLSLRIKSFGSNIKNELNRFEKDLFTNKLTKTHVQNYHIIIEEMSNEIYQYIQPKILEVLNNQDEKEFFKDTYNYSKKELKSRNKFLNLVRNPNIQLKIDSISKLLYLLEILINEEINHKSNIVNLTTQKLISSKIDIVESSEKSPTYRDIVVHTLKSLTEYQIKNAISSFVGRQILSEKI